MRVTSDWCVRFSARNSEVLQGQCSKSEGKTEAFLSRGVLLVFVAAWPFQKCASSWKTVTLRQTSDF